MSAVKVAAGAAMVWGGVAVATNVAPVEHSARAFNGALLVGTLIGIACWSTGPFIMASVATIAPKISRRARPIEISRRVYTWPKRRIGSAEAVEAIPAR